MVSKPASTSLELDSRGNSETSLVCEGERQRDGSEGLVAI